MRSMTVRESTGIPAALFDFDGTIIRVDTTVSMLRFLVRHFPAALKDLAPLAVTWPAFLCGAASRESLKAIAVRSLRNIPRQSREGFFRDFHDRCLLPRYLPGAIERIHRHREQGHTLVLVSASIDLYLRHTARHLGFDHLVCTRASLEPDPRLLSPNCHGNEKVRRLSGEEFFRHTIWKDSWAYGDDVSDVPMLEVSGHPVAVNPRRRLKRHATRAGWEILEWQEGRRGPRTPRDG